MKKNLDVMPSVIYSLYFVLHFKISGYLFCLIENVVSYRLRKSKIRIMFTLLMTFNAFNLAIGNKVHGNIVIHNITHILCI